MSELCVIIQGACNVYVELVLMGLSSEDFMVTSLFRMPRIGTNCNVNHGVRFQVDTIALILYVTS
jgi:hypothetical protein